jgi:ubiquinone/menaquinone biosynthesis C-methylase UbiE
MHEPELSLEIYHCIKCHGSLILSKGDCFCDTCGQKYNIINNILDTLIEPSHLVIKELKGTARENGHNTTNWEKIKINLKDKLLDYEKRLSLSEDEAGQYYLQTLMHFKQAFKLVKHMAPRRVLEIGISHDEFLKRFKKLGSKCYSINIHYELLKGQSSRWFERCLGDMNRLPYKDEVFDIVLISASAHHSGTPELLFKEVFRVLTKGGKAIVINEPVRGIIKRLVRKKNETARDNLINEQEYFIWQYNKIFRSCGFKPMNLFSDYYDQKLYNNDIHPRCRFGRIMGSIASVWSFGPLRNFGKKHLLLPAQAIFGFPLNVILDKIE